MKHLTSVDDLTNEEIDLILYETDKLKKEIISKGGQKILATFFYEPSTRTRLSFECAAHKLGMNILSVPDANCSSSAKGETLEDTVKTVAELADILILRHNQVGAAKLAANISKIPVINAGDGSGEHPTQALLDLYTIKKKFDNINSLKALFFGDLIHARTTHSLIKLLKNYTNNKIKIYEASGANPDDFESRLKEVDILYVVRNQVERWAYPEFYENWIKTISMKEISLMKPEAIVMHPLPRLQEIDPAIDQDKRVIFFEQVNNGLYVRMSVINYILSINKI